MIIENEIKTRRIELTTVDSEKDYFPSYQLKIKLSTEEIQATFNRSIWISEADLDSFIVKLHDLETTRRGDEKLNSMSPGEFQLRFRNLDERGHLAVELQLMKKSYPDPEYSDLIKVEFEIDPTSLLNIVTGLNELKTHANKAQ
ncbi:MAG: hypothetical protein RIG62_30545 [Cyclobacteriaceae bacterium]